MRITFCVLLKKTFHLCVLFLFQMTSIADSGKVPLEIIRGFVMKDLRNEFILIHINKSVLILCFLIFYVL